jgi:hypothetical protein
MTDDSFLSIDPPEIPVEQYQKNLDESTSIDEACATQEGLPEGSSKKAKARGSHLVASILPPKWKP